MRTRYLWRALLMGLLALKSASLQATAQLSDGSLSKVWCDTPQFRIQAPYQRRDTWYDFILKQFNPDNVDCGKWIEKHRREFIDLCFTNPYFLYSFWSTVAILLAASICVKQRIDQRRRMWITSEIMADLYNQDAYSRKVALEAIDRYNKHIERCNRAIEAGERPASSSHEIEQLRTELMRVAEERDTAIRDRDIARGEVRRKSEILADTSVRLDAATSKAGTPSSVKMTSDPRGADAGLVAHINNLQEQLYAERSSNRRLKSG